MDTKELEKTIGKSRREYKDFLQEIQRENLKYAYADHNFFEKALLYLAAGAFVVSISLLKDVISVEGILLPWLLIVSWSLFTVSILSNLCSYKVSLYFYSAKIQTVNKEKLRIVDNIVSQETVDQFNDEFNKLTSKRKSHVSVYNEIATVTFGIAVLSMSVFSIVNVWYNSGGN